MNSAIADLPIRAAIDVVLRDVGYSNSMPDWLVAKKVDYSTRQMAIENKMDQYLSGNSPRKPFEVLVPRKRSGVRAKWLQPSVNDQMILQTCVSALAPKIDTSFDRKRVFSYRYNTDPNSLLLTQDQCSAWEDYIQATIQNGQSCTHIMLMDLEQSFASIDKSRFLDFLTQFSSGVEIKLLKTLLSGFSEGPTGVPLINNSIFFLGNAYFSVVDRVISKHTTDFHRFSDDYCVFGVSKTGLEALYKDINKDIQNEGFKLNEIKLNIVSAQDYCDQLSKANEALSKDNLATDETDAYVAVPTGVDPNVMVSSLANTVSNPEKYLNDGTGRFQLASLRKLRDSLPTSARHDFVKDLTDSSEVLQASSRLLSQYAHNSAEIWRSVWLLYLMKDVDLDAVKDHILGASLRQTLGAIPNAPGVPEVVKLWARVRSGAGSDALFEQLSDADYEDAGRRCCGG
jgi:hypothetical protein